MSAPLNPIAKKARDKKLAAGAEDGFAVGHEGSDLVEAQQGGGVGRGLALPLSRI